MLDALRPYIYDWTYMCEALRMSFDSFRNRDSQGTKVLVIVSDGQSTDGDPVQQLQDLTAEGNPNEKIWVVTCFITDPDIPSRKELFDHEDQSFADIPGALPMFRMSSTIRVDIPAFAILRNANWTLPASGACRLFLQVNNQIRIREFLEHAHEIFQTDDALGHVLHRVNFERIVGEEIRTFERQDQGNTPRCWLYAISTAVYIVLVGIRRNPPSFDDVMKLVTDVVIKDDPDALLAGHHVLPVLEKLKRVLPLVVEEANEYQARQGIHAKNPSVVTMQLPESQMNRFKAFFRIDANKSKIMTRADLGPCIRGEQQEAHAIVLIRASPDCLTFLNSWGSKWGDDGCFRIENPADFRMTFVTVASDITRLDREDLAFMTQERERLVRLTEARTILHGESIKCPNCHGYRRAEEYKGSCLRLTCPICDHQFPPGIEALSRLRYAH
jgi:hypothetical protein